MIKNKLLMFVGFLTVVSCGNVPKQSSQLTSITDVAALNLNSDNTYTVFCANGTWEKITAADLNRNDLCPNSRNPGQTSNIKSLLSRNDGTFDVVCKDESKTVASANDIIAGKVCAVDDPFNPNSCSGPAMTREEVLKKIQPGESQSHFLGQMKHKTRNRKCNQFTGCAEWIEDNSKVGFYHEGMGSSAEGGYFYVNTNGNVVFYFSDIHGGDRYDRVKYETTGTVFDDVNRFSLTYKYPNDINSHQRVTFLTLDMLETEKISGKLTNSCFRMTSVGKSYWNNRETWLEKEVVFYSKL